MNDIVECAKYYSTLLNKNYKYILEDGLIIEFYFTSRGFYHIIGLHKLDDITILNNASLLQDIIDNKEVVKLIERSCKLPVISPRIEHFNEIENIFDINQCGFIVDFDKNLVKGETELKFTKYLLYKKLDISCKGVISLGANVILTLGKNKNDKIYPETFFYEPSNKYNSGQKLLEVNNIIISPKNNKKSKNRFSIKNKIEL